MCDAEAHMSPRAFHGTCPEPSAAWPTLAESPEEEQLAQNCTSANVMNVSSPWFLQLTHSTDEGRNK